MIPIKQTEKGVLFNGFEVGHATMIRDWRCNICEGQLTVRNGDIVCYKNSCEPDFVREEEIRLEQNIARDVIAGLPDELKALYQPKRWSPESGYICRDCNRKENVKTIYQPWPGICPHCGEFETLYPIKGEDHVD
jgi:transposase-like protein